MKLIDFKVKVERETDVRLREWADDEGRSKTRHVSILMRRLAALRETNAADLVRLGLLAPDGARA